MKLMRYGAKGAEKPALVDDHGRVHDLSGVLPDITASPTVLTIGSASPVNNDSSTSRLESSMISPSTTI